MQWKGRVIDKIKGFQQCWNDELLMEGRVDMREISLCDPQIEEIRAKKNYNDLKHIYIEERVVQWWDIYTVLEKDCIRVD